MKITEDPNYISEIKQNPEIVFSVVDFSKRDSEKYYSIEITETNIGYGEDQYGRYKTSDEKVSLKLFDSREEMEDHHIGLAESRDDGFDFEILSSGMLPFFVTEGIK